MPRIESSIGLGSGFPRLRWGRLLGMTSDWTGHRLLPWRHMFTLSTAIVTSYNMDGSPHRLVIYRELQANCKCLPMSIPCPSAQLCPFKCCGCPFFMPGIGHTCRGLGIRIHIPASQVKAWWPPVQMSSTLACLVEDCGKKEWLGSLGWKVRR